MDYRILPPQSSHEGPDLQRKATGPHVERAQIMNKAEWHIAAARAVHNSHGTGEPLSVLFIDLNYFKELNDELGHDVGDTVIDDFKELISEIEQSFLTRGADRQDEKLDVVSLSEKSPTPLLSDQTAHALIDTEGGHIGGDEFAILAHTDEQGALEIAQSVRDIVSQYINRPDKQSIKQQAEQGFGTAIGVATLEPKMSSSELLRKADENMYEDKMGQLKELDDYQRKSLALAKKIIEHSGIRLRDVPKYWRRENF